MSTNKRTHRSTRRGTPPPPEPQNAIDPAFARFLRDLEFNFDFVSSVGRPAIEHRILAQRLTEVAFESPTELVGIHYWLRALRLDPAALDARVSLAIAAGGPRDEFIEELQNIVDVGEAALGPKFFAEHRGHFWDMIETRPYMRARMRLIFELAQADRTKDAILHCEEMFQLNPNDSLGLRHVLVGLYLEAQDLAAARRILDRYSINAENGGEASPVFLWGLVLERYLAGDLPGALKALPIAREQNRHVEEFITGRKKQPKTQREYSSPCDTTEAIECMDVIGRAWTKNREAVQWLKKEHGSGRLYTNVVKKK